MTPLPAALRLDPPRHPDGRCYAVVASGIVTYTHSRDAAIARARELRDRGHVVQVFGATVWHDHRGKEWIARARVLLDD